MTNFLFKSTLAMAVLLGLYYILFEREKMHRFNRFYLLSALVFSLVLPFVIVPIHTETFSQATVIADTSQIVMSPQVPYIVAPGNVYKPLTNYIPYILWSVYCIVTVLLTIRFTTNIITFFRKAKNNPSVTMGKTKLILLEESVLPHTFLNYIFVNREEYEAKLIEDELYTHEYTHVKQKHTLDILFIEALKTLFWFNPLLYFYKKAIQLNHEFLADEKVIDTTANTIYYQKLLLEKATVGTTFSIASNLTFSLTKKRFIMMTKTTSTTKAGFIKLAILPAVTILMMLLCTETIAEVNNMIPQVQPEKQETTTQEDKRRDNYYAGVTIIVKKRSGELVMSKQYEELTLEQKREYLFFVPQGLPEKKLTENRFEDYKNSKKFAVWIDDKHVSDKVLSSYTPTSFVSFTESFVHINARSKKFPQEYQVHLYTRAYYDEVYKNPITHFSGKTYIYTLPDKKQTTKSAKKTTVTTTKNTEAEIPKSSVAASTDNNTTSEKQERLTSHINRAMAGIPVYNIKNMTVSKTVTQQQVDSLKIAAPKLYVSNSPADYGKMVIEYTDEKGNNATKAAFIEQ